MAGEPGLVDWLLSASFSLAASDFDEESDLRIPAFGIVELLDELPMPEDDEEDIFNSLAISMAIW